MKTGRFSLCRFAISPLYIIFGAYLTLVAQQRPALTVDDLLMLGEIADVSLSPDGQTIAYVQRRPRASLKAVNLQSALQGSDHGDVWLASVNGGRPIRITDGRSDEAGFWQPSWSPDGTHLAMLSTRGNNVRLWVREKAGGHLQLMSQRGIAHPESKYAFQFGWIDDHRLAAVLLPEGERSEFVSMVQSLVSTTTRNWQKALAGQETTSSVVESGVPLNLASRPQQEAVLFGLPATTQAIASGVDLQDLLVSGDGGYIDLLR